MVPWDAIGALAALMVVVGGVVHFTVRGALAQFEKELHEVFTSKEWGKDIERRISALEDRR